MAAYKSGSVPGSAVSATTNHDAIDLRGYDKLAIQLTIGTCTDGGAGHTAAFNLQTSNDNANWTTIVVLVADAQPTGYDQTTTFHYLPDYATAGDGGFGRYIRFNMTVGAGDTVSMNYNIYWEAKG